MSNGGANFLITQDIRAAVPGGARHMLRSENRAIDQLHQYVGANPPPTARVDYDRGAYRLTIPDDAAVVMIGNTPELEAALKQAFDNGTRSVHTIETTNGRPLRHHYVRMRISSWQNDTLLVIGSPDYWAKLGSRPPDSWKELGAQDRDYVSLLDRDSSDDPNTTSNLRYMVQWIKAKDAEPTVDGDGVTLH
jgi:hypothetical protein